MKKKIFALLMAMVLVLGLSTTALADINSPSVDNTPEWDSPTGDNTPDINSPSVDNEPVEMGEVKVTWSTTEKWTIEVENVTPEGDLMYWYDAEIFKDGVWVEYTGIQAPYGKEIVLDLSEILGYNGTGKYTVKIYVNHWDDNKDEWVYTHTGVSEACAYTAAEEKLAMPANLSLDKETGILTFDVVKDAARYDVYTKVIYAGEDYGRSFATWVYAESISGDKVEVEMGENVVNAINAYEKEEVYKTIDFTYMIEVIAVSGNYEKLSNSEYAKLVLFENKVSKEQAKENFDKAFENVEENPNEAVTSLSGVSNETIIEMMETDAAFVEKFEKLDAIFVEELADGYKGATSETKLVDADKVEIVGLAINGRHANESVEITFAEPTEKVEVEDKYENAVALDIELLVDGYAPETLEVPVTITMPIPAGVEKENLVILHYHGTATEPVVIVPTINEDGTMTFIVDGFSTFVIANQVVEAMPEKPAPEAPKTGDASTTTFVCSLLLLAAGVVLVSKRNSFVK